MQMSPVALESTVFCCFFFYLFDLDEGDMCVGPTGARQQIVRGRAIGGRRRRRFGRRLLGLGRLAVTAVQQSDGHFADSTLGDHFECAH